MQESSVTTAINQSMEAADNAVDQLPHDSQAHKAATSVLEAVEDVVVPEHLVQKRLKRKQQKARYVQLSCCDCKFGCAVSMCRKH